jgi:DNA-binding NarL/FixJ family response regulator
MTPQITVFTTLKNCFRCGTEFRTHGQQRVCPSCRKPKQAETRGFLSRELTIRERQIVGLIRFGKPNKEIASLLHLTEGTVKEYLNRIFRKAEVSNRTELAVWAFRHQVAA